MRDDPQVLRRTLVDEDDVSLVASTHGTNAIVTVTQGHTSTINSTSSTLIANAVFTGTWEDVRDFGVIVVTVKASHASSTNGLVLEFSSNGTNIDSSDSFTIPAATGKTFSFQAATQYFRIKYTNGGSDQTYFRLQTILKPYYVKPSSHRIQDAISTEDDAELVKSVLTGEDQDNAGTFVNVKTTTDGNLTISDNSNGLAIAEGNVTGTTFVHKFGNAPDFDTDDGEVTVWDGAEDATAWENMIYNYSTSAAIDSISSSDAGDTVDIAIQGLDSNYDLVEQTITLQGQTRVPLSTDLIRVFRAYNDGATNLVGHVFVYENDTLTGGVPDDPELIRLVIHPENNQTEMAVYTIPNGKTGYLRSWYATTAGANKSSSYILRLKARITGKTFRLKHKLSIADDGTSYIQHVYVEPEVLAAKTDLEITVEATGVGVTAATVSAGFDIVLVDD